MELGYFGSGGGSALRSSTTRAQTNNKSQRARSRTPKIGWDESLLSSAEAEVEKSKLDDWLSKMDHDSREDDRTKLQALEEYGVKSLYPLIECFPVDVNGSSMMTKLLFITNKQAGQIDLNDLTNFTYGMDFTHPPQLVINLIKSYAHHEWTGFEASETFHWSLKEEDGGNGVPGPNTFTEGFVYSELGCEVGLTETDNKIAMFLKEVVLPMAIQTHALVMVDNNSCSLSKAFGELVAAEAAKRGGKVPFTTLCVCGAPEFHLSSLEGESV